MGVGVSVFSSDGRLNICIAADTSIVSHPELLRQCVVEELRELASACKVPFPPDYQTASEETLRATLNAARASKPWEKVKI